MLSLSLTSYLIQAPAMLNPLELEGFTAGIGFRSTHNLMVIVQKPSQVSCLADRISVEMLQSINVSLLVLHEQPYLMEVMMPQ